MKKFIQTLNVIKSELSQESKSAAMKPQINLGPPFPTYTLSKTHQHKIAQLLSVIDTDIERFTPRARSEQESEEATRQQQKKQMLDNAKKEGLSEQEIEKLDSLAEQKPASSSAIEIDSFIRTLEISTEINIKNNPHLDAVKLSRMAPHLAELYALIDEEMRYLKNNMSIMSSSAAIVQKLDKAHAFVGANRMGDALNILHRLKKDAPNNRAVSFITSQTAYFMSRSGMTQHLSEAREEGKKACLLGDGIDEGRLHKYRYSFIMSEAHYSTEKVLPKMREFYLLSPESLMGKDGYNAHNAYHFKSLLFLTKVPATEWTSYERQTVIEFAYNNIGGALLYIALFRPLILDHVIDGKKDFEIFAKLEEDLQYAFIQYSNCVNVLQENFTSEGRSINAGKYFWTVRSRYLQNFLNAASLPHFDTVLSNISLNGRRMYQEGPTVQSLKDNGLSEEIYWNIWARKVTPVADLHREDAIPDAIVLKESNLLSKYEEALAELQQAEKELTATPKWEPSQPFIIKFDYSKLIEQATGKASSINTRSPSSNIFKPYYQLWNGLTEPEILPSDLVLRTARNGGFDNLDEIQDLFDGIAMVLEDDLQGMKARIDSAYQKYLRHKAEEEGSSSLEILNLQDHFKEYWWLYLVVVPLAFIVFAMVVFSQDYMTALKSVGILAAGGLFISLILLKK